MQFATPSAKSTFLHSHLPWHLPLTFASICSLIAYFTEEQKISSAKKSEFLFVCLLAGLSGWRGPDKCQSQQGGGDCWEGRGWAGLLVPATGAAGRFSQDSSWELMCSYQSANTVLLHGDHNNGSTTSSNYWTSVSYWDRSCSTVPMQCNFFLKDHQENTSTLRTRYWTYRQQFCWPRDPHGTDSASLSIHLRRGRIRGFQRRPCHCQPLQVQTTWDGFASHVRLLSRSSSLQNKRKMKVLTVCTIRFIKCIIILHVAFKWN